MSSVNEKLDAAETGYGSIKDEPKAGGGLKLIVIGMLIGTFIGVVGTMALISPHSPLAQFSEGSCICISYFSELNDCYDKLYGGN